MKAVTDVLEKIGKDGNMPSSPKGLNPWGMIGQAADTISGFIPPPDSYEGEYGHIQAGADKAYDSISNTLMGIPPWGTIAGGIMKGAGLLNKGMQKLGAGTDGMTKLDAILGSNFLGPIGWINGWTGSKSATMQKDDTTWALTGNSYTGAMDQFDSAMSTQGKKYGGFSGKARRKANEKIYSAGKMQNNLSYLTSTNDMRNETLSNQQDLNNLGFMNTVNGGYNQSDVRAAKQGGILNDYKAFQRAHKIAYHYTPKINIDDIFTVVENPDTESGEQIEMFQNGGQMNLIPEGALHANKHHLEEIDPDLDGKITHKGIPVVTEGEGGEIEQVAEIERFEIIFNKDLTDQVEELREKYHKTEKQSEKDEIARQAGELISNDIIENTKDESGFINNIEE